MGNILPLMRITDVRLDVEGAGVQRGGIMVTAEEFEGFIKEYNKVVFRVLKAQ